MNLQLLARSAGLPLSQTFLAGVQFFHNVCFEKNGSSYVNLKIIIFAVMTGNEMKRRVLVTGANGQLGREMRQVAAGAADEFIFADVVTPEGFETELLDITDAAAVEAFIAERQVDVIVNCAAYTNVDAAENDAAAAGRLNSEAPGILAGALAPRGGLLIHISTDYVFGGDSPLPYTEDMPCAPTSVYGDTKLRGEMAVRASGCDHVIIRTAWLYSEYGRNFCRTMLNLTSSKPQVRVVFDQTGTPTYALDLAEAIMAVLEDSRRSGRPYPHSGTYHFSDEGVCSWFDFARKCAMLGGNSDRCTVLPCHSSEYPSPVRRPAYSVLDKTLIKKTFGLNVPHWEASLEKCISNMLKNETDKN